MGGFESYPTRGLFRAWRSATPGVLCVTYDNPAPLPACRSPNERPEILDFGSGENTHDRTRRGARL